ncbi:ABC transporter permease [Lacihabitans sp. LS3-19]|uniref:ABC transporter permease n=1 Tax=Lacihabitans sp. LS3-19 TaxID=2487335 RepID=UPI0020CD0E33|nr:ABC transporter permease [Lacihabitans sp. LS3-19]MCP9766530.1 ABC transporter permease [Lacihabitans sp. LS3-19]
MIKNYFKIAIRSLWKNKLFSFINIVGLGLALPFALLSLLQLQSTFEFDNFHQNPERIFRIITDEKTNEGGQTHYASTPYLLADLLENDYPTIETATKTARAYNWELNNTIKSLRVNTLYVEPTFFSIFHFKIQNGSLPIEPNTLVLSSEMAEKFYGKNNPVGQTLTHPTFGVFKITGVLKPFKKETQFQSDVMVSMSSFPNAQPSWGDYENYTFVKIKDGTRPEALDLALAQIAKKTNPFLIDLKKRNDFRKQALASISPSKEDLQNNPYVNRWSDIYFNFTIPVMILLLAGFNYTNLTLARSLNRSREVGVRKVMGAVRSQLILQFMVEAIMIAFFALLIGILVLMFMKQYIHVNWVTWEVDNQYIIMFLFVFFTLVLGVSAGSLPAWILSSFQPVKVLKGSVSPSSFGKFNLRKVLMVIQFVVAMAFIFQIGHMYNQFNYMATENGNFNRKGIANISISDENYPLLINEISKNKNVEKVGLCSVPFGGSAAEYAIKADKKDEYQASYYYAADKNFIENMHLSFLAGQNLPISSSDSAGNFVIINEKAIEKLRLGSAKEAIGKSMILNNSEVEIIGVIKNFCHFNYQSAIQPLVFQYNPAAFQTIVIQTNTKTSKSDFEAEMLSLWKKQYPFQQQSFGWSEIELYERYYPAEDMKMMGMACFVILIIAVMGLLGMVIYNTEKRFREIGIRKVMGASVFNIVKTLSGNFLKLIFISSLIAIPIGIIGGVFFKSFFVFHPEINISLMALFFVAIFIIALFTIGFFSYKAANLNPVKSLKAD